MRWDTIHGKPKKYYPNLNLKVPTRSEVAKHALGDTASGSLHQRSNHRKEE